LTANDDHHADGLNRVISLRKIFAFVTVLACVFGAGRLIGVDEFGYAYLLAWIVGCVVLAELFGHGASLLWSLCAGILLMGLFIYLVTTSHHPSNGISDRAIVLVFGFGCAFGVVIWAVVRFIFYICFRLQPGRPCATKK